MSDEKMVRLMLKSAFGKEYDVYALPRAEIEKILRSLSMAEVIKVAYDNYCPNCADGVCYLNVCNGKLEGATYTQGTGEIEGAHLVRLYTVKQNLDLTEEDVLSDEEQSEFYEWGGRDVRSFCKNKGIDYDERAIDALVVYAKNEIPNCDSQLEDIYLQTRNEEI